jgi:hypothetical protein
MLAEAVDGAIETKDEIPVEPAVFAVVAPKPPSPGLT